MKLLKPYLMAMLSVSALTFLAWLSRDLWTLANFTVIYLLLVLIGAIRLGTYPAMFLAFASFLCINYFLIVPYYTFYIADTRHVLDLFIFLIVAILAGQLGSRARQEAANARERALEQEILYRLTGQFNQLSTQAEVLDVLVKMVLEELAAQQAFVLPYANTFFVQEQENHYFLLKANGKSFATLCVSFKDALEARQLRLLNTCTAQAAMALQRIELSEQASKSQQFEEADKLKTAILHAVSHDLRTPITIIKSSAHNLRTLQQSLGSQAQAELAGSIEKEADHLNTLVGNLLDLSRLRAGALNLNLEINSLEEVAGDVAARIWQLTGLERSRLLFPSDFPFSRFDYGLMQQALGNLVENALRYEPSDSQIELNGSYDANFVFLRVINHGPAIPKEERDFIMEPFYHGVDGHIGLGLAIAKGIIEAHHGHLELEDCPETGASFLISLPRSKGAIPGEPKNPGR
jgi:two-component system, OmpR family, sensor histidine kinase KdpD